MTNIINEAILSLSAFAPATSANLGVGFDILGLALDAVGDKVTLTRRQDNKIVIEAINSVSELPRAITKNTAAYALHIMCKDLNINCGFTLAIDKGIAIGSGMGGSAASAVAAVVALNGFLLQPVSKEKLVEYALYGEEIASGGRHADNVAPCVFGGITLVRSLSPLEIINLPYPDLYCVIVHPHFQVETKSARSILKPDVPLPQYVEQSAQLAATICAFYQKDLGLLKRSMSDLIIEPQRANLVPGYYAVKQAALANDAIAATLSGSGPSLLAFCLNEAHAKQVAAAMLATFEDYAVAADYWLSPINPHGAYIVDNKVVV